jgi:glyoxylase I family protein
MKFSIHHVAISVTNLEQSIQFYSTFGFSELIKWDSVKGGLKLCHLKLDNVILELFCYETTKSAPESASTLKTDLPRIGVKHFALEVDSIDKAKQFVIDKGIVQDVEITRGTNGLSYFFIKDPDGILFELIEDKRNLKLNEN